jgi:hypothetical protein
VRLRSSARQFSALVDGERPTLGSLDEGADLATTCGPLTTSALRERSPHVQSPSSPQSVTKSTSPSATLQRTCVPPRHPRPQRRQFPPRMISATNARDNGAVCSVQQVASWSPGPWSSPEPATAFEGLSQPACRENVPRLERWQGDWMR